MFILTLEILTLEKVIKAFQVKRYMFILTLEKEFYLKTTANMLLLISS